MSVGPGENPYVQGESRSRSKSITAKSVPAAPAKQTTAAKPHEKENHDSNHAAETVHQSESHESKPKSAASMSYADIARTNSPQPVPKPAPKESAEQAAGPQGHAAKAQPAPETVKPRKQSDPNKFKRPKKTAKTAANNTGAKSTAVANVAQTAVATKPAAQTAGTTGAQPPKPTGAKTEAVPSTVPEVNSSEATAVTNNA
jgi:hypothetical protein